MDEERVHYHEITISKKVYPYYLISCESLELPDDDYSLEFEGAELIKVESARFRRWLGAIAKHLEEFKHLLEKLDMLSYTNEKDFDSEKFETFRGSIADFCCDFGTYQHNQYSYITVFRMIADENSHSSRMSNLESTVLRLENRIEGLDSGRDT